MKNVLIKTAAVLLAVCTALFLASCGKQTEHPEEEIENIYEKASMSETVKIVNIPTDTSELRNMLNAALNYVDEYCYKYTKAVKCDANVTNLGSFSDVSNASDAFASMFGEKNVTADFDYKADKKLFEENFVKGPIEKEEITSISAKQEDDVVVLTAELNSESNPTDESGILHRLGGDYVGADDVKASITEFKSSASSVSVSADEISITARISTEDSSLKSLTVKYTEHFNLAGVTLVKISGGSVGGNAKTTVEYTNFG